MYCLGIRTHTVSMRKRELLAQVSIIWEREGRAIRSRLLRLCYVLVLKLNDIGKERSFYF